RILSPITHLVNRKQQEGPFFASLFLRWRNWRRRRLGFSFHFACSLARALGSRVDHFLSPLFHFMASFLGRFSGGVRSVLCVLLDATIVLWRILSPRAQREDHGEQSCKREFQFHSSHLSGLRILSRRIKLPLKTR